MSKTPKGINLDAQMSLSKAKGKAKRLNKLNKEIPEHHKHAEQLELIVATYGCK